MLEERVAELEQELSGLRERLARLEAAPPARVTHPDTAVPSAPQRRAEAFGPGGRLGAPEAPARQEGAAPRPQAARSRVPARPALDLPDLEDLLGGRVLAWLGGAAVLIGLAFLMALAVSSGWIGEGARTATGAAASVALMAVGLWLHERRGRTDAALAALSSGIAAMFAVVTVASQVY
ncbi:MAG: DUF2339 domain-containing protein, partial [Thermoleophilaceae bacterium]